MEIYLLFLFFILAILLTLVAYLFDVKVVMVGPAIILLFLSYNIISEGYSTQITTSSQSNFAYTLNETTSSQLLTQLNQTETKLYQKTQNDFTNGLGFILFGFSALCSFLVVRG